MRILAFIDDAAPGALRRGRRPSHLWIGAAFIVLGAISGAADAQTASGAAAPLPGAVAQAPLTDRLREAVLDSVRSQLLDPATAEIRILVHFPLQRGDNGRVCGEVEEPAGESPRVRTFFSIYTRAGRVLTRLEDGTFEAYLAQDKVFRNCSPRI